MPTWQDAVRRFAAAERRNVAAERRNVERRTENGARRNGKRQRQRESALHEPSRTIAATISPIARQEVRPGDSMPAAWTTRAFSRSRRIRKSANDSVGRVQLRADPAARQPQVADGDASAAVAAHGVGEFLDRQAVALVVVFPLLIPDGRTKPDVARRSISSRARRGRGRPHAAADRRAR